MWNVEHSKSDLNWGKSPNFLHEFFYTFPFPSEHKSLCWKESFKIVNKVRHSQMRTENWVFPSEITEPPPPHLLLTIKVSQGLFIYEDRIVLGRERDHCRTDPNIQVIVKSCLVLKDLECYRLSKRAASQQILLKYF